MGRGASVARGPFPHAALRTRRAVKLPARPADPTRHSRPPHAQIPRHDAHQPPIPPHLGVSADARVRCTPNRHGAHDRPTRAAHHDAVAVSERVAILLIQRGGQHPKTPRHTPLRAHPHQCVPTSPDDPPILIRQCSDRGRKPVTPLASPVRYPLRTRSRTNVRARKRVAWGCPPEGGCGAYRGVMSIHKLTAGDGYSYLTRQVAVLDATDRGHTGLADYYTQRGESPGVWLGSALADVDLQTGLGGDRRADGGPVRRGQAPERGRDHPGGDGPPVRRNRPGRRRGGGDPARAAIRGDGHRAGVPGRGGPPLRAGQRGAGDAAGLATGRRRAGPDPHRGRAGHVHRPVRPPAEGPA